ncbi:MAG: ribosomal-processing cysteine protease Prp [Lachnospiraceae bacterium]|nr:ribosomal-processing cysteine protease Prp [Lachnospiraceae bacterium]
MITVKTYGDRENFKGFKVEGHALFDDPGKDVICAAVSILTINTINAIDEFVKGEKMEISTDEDRGIIECRFTDHRPGRDAMLLIDAFLLGIRGIEKEYGREYLRLESEI